MKTESVGKDEVKNLGILDFGLWNKEDMFKETEAFIKENDFLSLIKKIKNLKKEQLI